MATVTREFDYNRVIYAITNPEGTAVVYVGDTEQGRDVRGRLKAAKSKKTLSFTFT
jgi:hypothetical protein